jgi:hypothetical protein
MIVALSKSGDKPKGEEALGVNGTIPRGIVVQIVRGVVPMHHALNGWAGGAFPFVHTTDLQEDVILSGTRYVRVCRRFVMGPAVLLPRVGEPKATKCVLYLGQKKLVLSDCVYALQCESVSDAETLRAILLDAWESVDRSFTGTCARHITLFRLRELLEHLGISVVR